MNLKFDESNLALVYLQTKLKEDYNNLIVVNGDYYKTFNINYGFAHYIFKYLNMMYPPAIESMYSVDLDDSVFETPLTTTQCMSIANYFVCDNRGNKLVPPPISSDGYISYVGDETAYNTYIDMYGRQINVIKRRNDLPIFLNNDYTLNKEDRVYNLYNWKAEKSICELDDLVMSYLLGRTIGPNSSREDIYYAQLLLIGKEHIEPTDKGKWDSDSGNLTNLLIDYQQSQINTDKTHPLFVTGYFDIYTESSLLRNRGEQLYGVYGL